MAGIDKIYGSQKDFEVLEEWLQKNKPEYFIYLYEADGYKDAIRPISNFSQEADVWLYNNCPISFVTERIREQYNGEPGDKEV